MVACAVPCRGAAGADTTAGVRADSSRSAWPPDCGGRRRLGRSCPTTSGGRHEHRHDGRAVGLGDLRGRHAADHRVAQRDLRDRQHRGLEGLRRQRAVRVQQPPHLGLDHADHRPHPGAGRRVAVERRHVRTHPRRRGRRRQRHRGAALDPRVSVLVAGDLRARHRDHPADLRQGRRGTRRRLARTSQRDGGHGRVPPVTESAASQQASGSPRLSLLLAMAMFVLVVDTSLMNVSISAVVDDLDTTVSGVQSAIALEALVSAAFILIGGKTGDLIGRKLAYVLGLLAYAVGAIAMTLAQSLTAIVIFWALIGGIGASLLLPAMQSLIHGNFEGADQKRVYALVGASAAIAAAVGPLLGGFITTFLSWRVGFLLEALIIAIVLSGIKLVHDVPYEGSRAVDWVGAALSVVGMGGVVLGILVWQEGGEYVGVLIGLGVVALGGFAWWLRDRKRRERATLIEPELFRSPLFRRGVSGQLLQQIALGGTMIVLPIYLQMVLGYNALLAGISIAPLSLSMFVIALLAGRRGKGRPSSVILLGFVGLVVGLIGLVVVVPRASSGWWLAIPLIVAGFGLGLLVSQLNNYTLSPISDERVSEAAGVNSAAGSFGLSFGLAFAGAIMLATLSLAFTSRAESSTVLSPGQQEQVATALEDDAQIMSDAHLQEVLAGQPPEVHDEIVSINTDVRPIALQVALLIPVLAGLLGIANALRMRKLPDPKAAPAAEGTLLG